MGLLIVNLGKLDASLINLRVDSYYMRLQKNVKSNMTFVFGIKWKAKHLLNRMIVTQIKKQVELGSFNSTKETHSHSN